jgi:hypothetical protein
MTLKRLALAGMAAVSLWGCASSLQTRLEPEQARSNIMTVLKENGFTLVDATAEHAGWKIIAERRQSYALTEKRFAIEQAPVLQTDPVNNNQTTFEERVDPTTFTLVNRSEPVTYKADIRLNGNGPERAVYVAVTGSTLPVSNKYREILWTNIEPPSPLQVETLLIRSLQKVL